MKKLSIKGKAEAYDEALNVTKNLVGAGLVYEDAAVQIFPELKEELEDEKIRNRLIEFISCNPGAISDLDEEKALSWLEKQGEQKLIDRIQLGKKYKCIASPRYSTFMIGKIYKPEDKFLCSLMNFCSDCFEPIEDGGQKPADKVEPEFKIGDWLVHNERRNIIKIVNSTPLVYEVVNVLGYHYTITDTAIENNYHLWTINDVKDGDVLAAHECLVLFKEIDGLNIRCYCTYHYFNHEKFYINTLHNKTAFWPATKEQRDALMKAMADAGYTFDFEKKELKNIKQLRH